MEYLTQFESPLGNLYITADEVGLTGVAFEQDKGNRLPVDLNNLKYSDNQPVLMDAKLWLSLYFFGSVPDFLPDFSLKGTDFCKQVWKIVEKIPYGSSMTYGEIANLVAKQRGTKASPQAVGNAVAKNPIAIIIPCHRVLAAGFGIGGYSAGLTRKRYLLELEHIEYRNGRIQDANTIG